MIRDQEPGTVDRVSASDIAEHDNQEDLSFSQMADLGFQEARELIGYFIRGIARCDGI